MNEIIRIPTFADECNIILALENYMRSVPDSKSYLSYLKTYVRICNGLDWYIAKFDENGEIKNT